jgi:hypothetical protein
LNLDASENESLNMHLALKAPALKTPERPFPAAEDFHRFSVAQYHQMIEAGILTENDRVELLDGWVITKMTHNPPHDGTIQLVDEELSPLLPEEWLIRIQSAITLSKSEPEPDLAVVRVPARRYLKAHPRPGDIGLLIEVAEATLTEDRDVKGPLYAQELIPIYWIVNIPKAIIEVYTGPKKGKKPRYTKRRDYAQVDTIPLVLDGQEIARIPVGEMLP